MRCIKVIAIVLAFCFLFTACAAVQTGANRKFSNQNQQSTILESTDSTSVDNQISSQQVIISSQVSNQISTQPTSSIAPQSQISRDTGVTSETSSVYSDISSVLSDINWYESDISSIVSRDLPVVSTIEPGSGDEPSSTTSTQPSSLTSSVPPVYPPVQPHFTIIDDDGKDDVYSVLMPLLNNRGIKFSTSVIPSNLNKNGNMTVEQLRKVVNAGNKVMCHGKSHINLKKGATTYEQRYDEIIGGKKMLADLGFDTDVMVYPEGAYNDEVIEITKSAYKYGISTAGDTVWGQQRYNAEPINKYAIKRIGIGAYYSGQNAEQKAQTLADAKENIDVCIEKNYLCVILTHIGDTEKDDIAQIVELIDYIEQKGYKIDDFDTAIEAHIPPDER